MSSSNNTINIYGNIGQFVDHIDHQELHIHPDGTTRITQQNDTPQPGVEDVVPVNIPNEQTSETNDEPWKDYNTSFFKTSIWSEKDCYHKLIETLNYSTHNITVIKKLYAKDDGFQYFNLIGLEHAQQANLLNQFCSNTQRFKAQDFADAKRQAKQTTQSKKPTLLSDDMLGGYR